MTNEITKETNSQMKRDLRARSTRVLSAGTSVPMELGHTAFPTLGYSQHPGSPLNPTV